MNILYVGDVMGEAGRNVLTRVLPNLKKELAVDFAIIQAENSDNHGKAPRPQDIEQMKQAGADFFTGGNHSFSNSDTNILYEDPLVPLVRPANVEDKPGSGYKIIDMNGSRILVASILGQTVGSQKIEITNPLHKADEILNTEKGNFDISIFNFHGDFSSEKRVFGYYLDGRVSLVVGDHWHVPTADAMVMPGGTGHITDVGMCGSLHSSLGVKTDVIIERWKQGVISKNEMELSGPYQFNAVLAEIDIDTGLCKNIEHIQRVIE